MVAHTYDPSCNSQRLRQKDCHKFQVILDYNEFKANLNYTVTLCLNKKRKKKTGEKKRKHSTRAEAALQRQSLNSLPESTVLV